MADVIKKIEDLFDPSRDIHRVIEKVITYGASQEKRLKTEISEYQVTESIEEQIERLLSRIQAALESGDGNEIGVWVSGFYGSGKSSFTKYLGLALDDNVQVDGVPFLEHLRNRLNRPQTTALLTAVAQRFSAAVVMLDLASEMIAGATMEEVSTVLYNKVLQWAGYSQNLKIAALERRLKKDDRYEEFLKIIDEEVGVPWGDIQNDPLVTDSVLPEIAHRIYPNLFKTESAFTTETSEIVRFETDRVKEMIEIVRAHSGKEQILFIIDEVGQYVSDRQNLILNLDGLAKNLKEIGEGKVWIVGTAQQTLTEDDATAALNSPQLYKLKDRFPINIDLESSDIREICYRRLLGKSPEGEKVIGKLFDDHGQELRHNTHLLDAKFYDSEFDKETFVNLYPFLPAHFDILLHLLGALAKSTGGIGLRSAIKVIQDILIEGVNGQDPVCEKPIGWLATTVTLFDALERDISQAFRSVRSSAEKATRRFPDSALHIDVAKTVAVLQILDNIPASRQNVINLMHPDVKSSSRKDALDQAIDDLIRDEFVPLAEQDGKLKFFSEKLHDIEHDRSVIPLRSLDTRRIFNETLTEIFTPLPSARLNESLVVKTGLKTLSGSQTTSLAGEREAVQTVVVFADPSNYDETRNQIVDESRGRTSQQIVYLVGPRDVGVDDRISEIYRCQEIARRHRNDPEQEVKEYCAAQTDRAATLVGELKTALRSTLVRGSFVFRGQATAVDSLDQDLLNASKKHLADVAKQVFDRNVEAPVRAESTLAEKFLRAGNLAAVTAAIDPLGLVQLNSGKYNIDTNHKALVSIRDHLDKYGAVEGKRLTDNFTDAPFGWSPDTLRYLVAGLLVAGEIRLKVSGREVTVNGQQAIEALRTNNAFKTVGVSLRDERPSIEQLARASQRLTELIGEQVNPLEEELSKAAAKHFPKFQQSYGPLSEKLEGLRLPGGEMIQTLNQEVTNILLTDASDVTQRLGGEESDLYQNLKTAAEVDLAMKNGAEPTIRDLQIHRRDVEILPASGIPGQLQEDLTELMGQMRDRLGQDDWYKHTADLQTDLMNIKVQVRDAAKQMNVAQGSTIKEAQQDLQRLAEWVELNQEQKSRFFGALEVLTIEASEDLGGLKKLLSQDFVIASKVSELKKEIESFGREVRRRRLEEEKEEAEKLGKKTLSRIIEIPASVTNVAELDDIIQELQSLKAELSISSDIAVTIRIEG
jgi:hypothetical protein